MNVLSSLLALALVSPRGVRRRRRGDDDRHRRPLPRDERPSASTFSSTARSGPCSREVDRDRRASSTAALEELLVEPTAEEEADLVLDGVPDGSSSSVTVEGGVASVELRRAPPEALAQVVYTLTQFRRSESVEIDGETLHARRLRGADARDPRRVAAPSRRSTARSGHRNREHVRGDVPVRAHRHRRETSSTRTSSRRPRAPGRVERSSSPRTVRIPFDDVGALVVFELRRGRLANQRAVEIPLTHGRVDPRGVSSLDVADAPWRCSQCGTVNEPVANACRTCGRWPSLFDLEQSSVDVRAVRGRGDVRARDAGSSEVRLPSRRSTSRRARAGCPRSRAGVAGPGGSRAARSRGWQPARVAGSSRSPSSSTS